MEDIFNNNHDIGFIAGNTTNILLNSRTGRQSLPFSFQQYSHHQNIPKRIFSQQKKHSHKNKKSPIIKQFSIMGIRNLKIIFHKKPQQIQIYNPGKINDSRIKENLVTNSKKNRPLWRPINIV